MFDFLTFIVIMFLETKKESEGSLSDKRFLLLFLQDLEQDKSENHH